jgi:hypothetical protein
MKNIHLLPTSKPSRLLYSGNNKSLLFSKEPISFRTFERSPQNIYITSDEEIKEGDKSLLFVEGFEPIILTHFEPIEEGYKGKKIILTTDPGLINDGVQAIDDEFLEWFVKNPNCEFVDVTSESSRKHGMWKPKYYPQIYKIIIPQEKAKQETIQKFIEKHGITEQQLIDGYKQGLDLIFENASKIDKQETLEEAAFRLYPINIILDYDTNEEIRNIWIEGAKWQAERMGLMEIELRHNKTLLASCEKALEDRDKQAERMYSEEEVIEIAKQYAKRCQAPIQSTEWLLEQFKKII